MRGFSIFLWCLVTAAMFYSAWRFKAPEIETDVTARVSQSVTEAGGDEIAVEVDGRHVNLRGFAASPDQKAEFLDTADATYGALGPIDGLMLPKAPARTYLSAIRAENGVVLSGVVGSEEERDLLITQANAADLGEVVDDLTVADGQIAWTENAQTGLLQLAGLEDGHLYVSDDRNTLSGNAATSEIATAAGALGAGWSAFVAGPQSENPRIAMLENTVAAKDTELATLSDQLKDRDGQIKTLDGELTQIKGDFDASQTQIAGLETELGQRRAHIALLTRDAKAKTLSLSDAAQTVDGQTSQISTLEAALAQRDAKADEMATEIADKTATIELLRKDGGEVSASLEAALAEKTAEVTDLEAALVELNAAKDSTIEGLNAEVATLSSQISEADATLTTTNLQFETNQNAKEAEIAALKAELETTKGNLGSTDEARLVALDLNKDLEAKLDAQMTQSSVLSEEIDALKGQLSDYEVAKTEIGQLQASVTQKDEKIAALMSDLEGQPEVTEVKTVAQCNDTAKALLTQGKINFVSNSADIVETSEPFLERITGVVLACSGPETDASVTVAGHTDDRGSDDANQTLSEARAQSVASFMIERGVDPKALQPVGFGETQPIADNETTEGRAENRRISFQFQSR